MEIILRKREVWGSLSNVAEDSSLRQTTQRCIPGELYFYNQDTAKGKRYFGTGSIWRVADMSVVIIRTK